MVASSVSGMDGGHDATPPNPAQPPDPEDELTRRISTRQAQAAKDAEVLAGVPFVAEALARMAAGVDDLLAVRWAALAAPEVAATVRVLAGLQARLDAAVLASIKAVDDREDLVPAARAKTAGARFLQHALHWDRRAAARQAETARLLDGDTGELAAVGAAYAAGAITRGHVEVTTSVHRRLHARVRDALIPIVDPVTGEESQRRCIEVVAAVLARQAQALTVPEFRRAADQLVEHLDPPSPDGAHQRRYLHLAQLPDGSLIGKFACGPAQALAFAAIIAAGAAPRPGTGIDPDGIEHSLPDERTPAQRRVDALTDALHAASADAGDAEAGSSGNADAANSATSATSGAEPTDQPDQDQDQDQPDQDQDDDRPDEAPSGEPSDGVELEPAREGREQIRRHPGVRTGPYPTTEILLTVTLDQLAAAQRLHQDAGTLGPPGHARLDQVDGFARAQHGGSVHPDTLRLLACSARLRTVILDSHGAVLHLGRRARLATAPQRRALLARDIGCIIPGCAVPGEHCDIHHVVPWADGGSTDLPNLVLLCPRHHTEVHQPGSWQIHMFHGIPWVRPPAWAHHQPPLLRNTTHRPHTGSAA